MIELLLAVRGKDPTYRPVDVDGLMYLALRNRGMILITQGLMEEGLYDLSLAERFGPLDRDAMFRKTLAQQYLLANSYFGTIKDFEICKVRSGKCPAVIFVDGWLSQKNPGLTEWEEGLEKNYPNNPWYEVKWESKRLKDIGKLIAGSAGKKALKKGLKEAAKRASRGSARKINPISWLYDLFVLSKNPWHTAMVRASMTGALIADILARVKRKEFILLGH